MGDVLKLENKMALYFENTKRDIFMTQKEKGYFDNINICRPCEKNESDKVTDHCRRTGKSRGPAHQRCNINVTQKQSHFIPFVFHNFSNFDCHLFYKRLVDKKKNDV